MEVPILMYHHVKPDMTGDADEFTVTPEMLEAQVAWLAQQGFKSVSVAEAAHRARGTGGAGGADPAAKVDPFQKVCVMTFDDGYENVWRHAVPVLERHRFVGTVFAIASYIGQTNAWSSGREPLMSADQLKALRAKGWTIGSHTCTHPHLPKLDSGRQREELIDSKVALQDLLGEAITTFAYPYNEWNETTHDLVKKAGYQYACAISSPSRTVFGDPWAVRRVFVKRSDSLRDFKRKTSSWYLKYRGWRKH